ncbi:MAG: hypothetical protein PHF86_04440 [Candidatus Nanoarchaeia archaeon]|jgi:hypothetical protein|nr:hypothetical protein [Candidatus Nanoarchaeia archaeon]
MKITINNEHIKILEQIASKQIQTIKKDFTLFITYWVDNTYFLELRHANKKGIHRFFYKPFIDSENIEYSISTIDKMMIESLTDAPISRIKI